MSVEDFKVQIEEETKKLEAVNIDADKKSDVNTETPKSEFSDIEKKAMEMGWKPGYKGEDFVSAKEYVDRGSFFKKISSQNQKIEQLELTVKDLVNLNKKIEQVTRENTIKELEAKRDAAIQTADLDEFHRVQKQIDEVKSPEPVKQDAKEPFTPTPEILDFQAKHKDWLNHDNQENSKMTSFAIAYEASLAKAHPEYTEKQVLAEIEEIVKKTFPHRFENPNKEKPALVAKSTVSSGTSGSLAHRLSDRQKSVFKQAKSIDPSLDIETYAKQLNEIGELRDE